MSNDNKILTTNNLSVGYGTGKNCNVLLSDLNIIIKRGELISLIGENGSGKSTLLRSLAGLQKVLSGNILIDDIDISNLTNKSRATKISFVSTELQGVNNISVFDIIALGRFPYTDWFGNLKQKDREEVYNSISRVGLEDLSSKIFSELSDGQKQRVMIARALSQDTDIIFLDEPTAFLDMPNKYEIINLLHEIAWAENKAIIFSVHDINIALRLSDKLWIISNRDIVSGAPEDLVLDGSIEKLFDERRLSFNKETGEISRTKLPGISICVDGEGTEEMWTRKALERLNFIITCNKSEDISVKVCKEKSKIFWKVNINGNDHTYNSIYDMTLYLRNLKT